MKQPDDPTLRDYTLPKRGQRPDPGSAGQSGDDMGLSDDEVEGGESVAELVQEGQFFEAEAVTGTERPYPDEGEVRTHEVPEDDVPLEYTSGDEELDTD
jgi:hypothetical protein